MDGVERVLFLGASAIAVLSSVLAITRKQPIFGVLYLFVLGLIVSFLFALKSAFFLALIQIIIYVGAVLVLFVFVISMMNLQPDERITLKDLMLAVPSLIFAVIFISVLFSEASFYSTRFEFFPASSVAKSFYKDFFFQFEFVSVLLLAGIIVTIFVGMRIKEVRKEGKEIR